MEDVFEQRCQSDPQGVIRDLVKQTSIQAGRIHDLNKEVDYLKLVLKEAGIAYDLIPKDTGKKKKKQNGPVVVATESSESPAQAQLCTIATVSGSSDGL